MKRSQEIYHIDVPYLGLLSELNDFWSAEGDGEVQFLSRKFFCGFSLSDSRLFLAQAEQLFLNAGKDDRGR